MSPIDYSGFALAKPTSRKTLKARAKREKRDKTAEVREYVFAREQGICRCCRLRRAESMHELVPRSLGGKVSKRNSVAVCGRIVGTDASCHTYLQRREIDWTGDDLRAEAILEFRPRTQTTADHLRVTLHEWLASGPTPQIRGEAE